MILKGEQAPNACEGTTFGSPTITGSTKRIV